MRSLALITSHDQLSGVSPDDHHTQTALLAESSVPTTVNNSTTLEDVTGLSVTLEANKSYRVLALIRFNTGATPDIKFGWSTPSSLFSVQGYSNGTPTDGSFSGGGSWANTCTLLVTGGDHVLLLEGVINVGANAGPLQLRMAQNSADMSDTTVEAGSALIALEAA